MSQEEIHDHVWLEILKENGVQIDWCTICGMLKVKPSSEEYRSWTFYEPARGGL